VVTTPGASCPRCGTTRGPQARFCAACGTPFPLPVQAGTSPTWKSDLRPTAWAGFWRRAFALLFDSIVLLLILLPVHFLARWLFDVALSRTVLDPGGHTFDRMTTLFVLLDQTVRYAIGLFYFVMFERSGRGGTIGKMITGCRVADGTGNRIGILRTLGRNLLKPISALPCFLGFLIAGFMPQKQALHDLIAGTRVVKRP